MKFLYILPLALLPAGAALAQADAAGPTKVTIYLAAGGSQLADAEGADHRAEITMRDSIRGSMKEFYPSGKLWRYVPYLHVGRGIRHGTELTYAESGQLQRRQEFVAGRRQGELQKYDAAGHLSRQTVFDQDKPVSRTCFTPTGAVRECKVEKQLPEYPGGVEGMVQDLEHVVTLPNDEVEHGVFGTVLVKFVVDVNAVVVGAVVAEAPTPGAGRAVVQALQKLRPFGEPGQLDDEPVEVLYTLPVRVGQPTNGWVVTHDTSGSQIDHKPTAIFLEEGKFEGRAEGLVPRIGTIKEAPSQYNPHVGTGAGSGPLPSGKAPIGEGIQR